MLLINDNENIYPKYKCWPSFSIKITYAYHNVDQAILLHIHKLHQLDRKLLRFDINKDLNNPYQNDHFHILKSK